MPPRSDSSLPIVAIVGRPNVGKSALFNRLAGKRIAIVDKEAGITRDRLYAPVQWGRKKFKLVDTGGLIFDDSDTLTQQVEKQASVAIAEAQKILFVVDARDGITALDQEIAKMLRAVREKVICCVNKVDDSHLFSDAQEFYALGYEAILPVSSLHGRGIGELLDSFTDSLKNKEDREEDDSVHIAVVGKPNAGKSSFVNALLEEERNIVSEIPGTTRDSIDTLYNFRGKKITLIDTAGIKRRKKVHKPVDHFSIVRSRTSIRRADVVLLMLDGSSGITSGDLKIAMEVSEEGKSCILLVNKWDLLEGTSQRDFKLDVYDRLGFLNYSPVIFTSVKNGKNIKKAVAEAMNVYKESQKKLATHPLNDFFKKLTSKTPPPVVGVRPLKIYYVTQTGTAPAEFLLFVNDARKMKESYKSFLVNQLRKKYGFAGVPIVLRCKTSR